MTTLAITIVVSSIETSAFSIQIGNMKNQMNSYNQENETEHIENCTGDPYQHNVTEPQGNDTYNGGFENETGHMENCTGTPYQYNVTEPQGNDTYNGVFSQKDLDAGWYFGVIDQKKPGTPDTWIHVGGGTLSARWVDPRLIY